MADWGGKSWPLLLLENGMVPLSLSLLKMMASVRACTLFIKPACLVWFLEDISIFQKVPVG